MSELAAIILGLQDPAAYPHPVGDVRVIQTHASVVFLAGDRAYKIKKPVDLGFLDYSTLELRLRFCERELQLNRRLAPDVYIEVAPIVRSDHGLEVGAPGPPIEYAVVMERLPDEHTLEQRVLRGDSDAGHVAEVAELLASFHRDADRSDAISAAGGFEIVAGNCRENFEQLDPMRDDLGDPSVLRRLREATDTELRARRSLIEQRAQAGVPCDTHGDLRLEHVYVLPDRPPGQQLRVVDCIEFNDRFRFADPVADIAFLVMDLRWHGRWDLARALETAYLRASDDREAEELMRLYVAYRATVRAKVEAMRGREPEVPRSEQQLSLERARGYLTLALGELSPRDQRPCLVLVGGLPGTGKSTLAGALAKRAGLSWIRSDVVRKELAGIDPIESARTQAGEGLYTPQWTERTYKACRRRAESLLRVAGRAVVDATFRDERWRLAFVRTAQRHGARVVLLICQLDGKLARERIDARVDDPSDADGAVHAYLQTQWQEPSPGVGRITHRIDTSGSIEDSTAAAYELLRQVGVAQ